MKLLIDLSFNHGWIELVSCQRSNSIIGFLNFHSVTRKSTLVFCVNLAHVRDLTNEFRAAGVDARYLHSGTPVMERKALLHSFKSGVFSVLVNCGIYSELLLSYQLNSPHLTAILTEGADIPNIDCVVVARPTRSKNVFAQMVRVRNAF